MHQHQRIQQNRVTQSARTIGARSGVGSGGTVPLTASRPDPWRPAALVAALVLGVSGIVYARGRRVADGARLCTTAQSR